MKRHFKIRPPADAREVERWTSNGWIPDDGKPGFAFSGRAAKGYPAAWFDDSDCGHFVFDEKCPRRFATQRTCIRFGCSNGSPIQHPSDVKRDRLAAAAAKRRQQEKSRQRRELISKARSAGLHVVASTSGPSITWLALKNWLDREGA